MYIMHNNKKYSTTDARNISFDNSNTSLESTNVQDSISELNKKIQNSVNGDAVGYYATKIFLNSELSNASKGSVTVTNRNGAICIIVQNLECTPNVPLLQLHGYVGNDAYFYDNDGTGLYIDKSILYSIKSTINHCVFTFFK